MRILIVDKMHDSLVSMLSKIGIDADYEPNITRKEIPDKLINYEGLIIRSKVRVNEKLIAHCKKLKVVCRAGAGIDNLDVDYLESRDIHIINAPEGNRNAVAEHCIALVFNLLNYIIKSNREVKGFIWDREGNRGHEIQGKTIGVIGYGFMGSTVAAKFKNLGCKVIAYDKYVSGFGDNLISEVTLDELFELTDILSIHVPLTNETRFMIDRNFLEKFKKNIWLVNTSRGEVVSLEAVVNGLQSKKILGAALDVIENEKILELSSREKEVFEKLASFENVILTPHVAGWTFESYQRINEVLVKKLKEFRRLL